jgi:hypothetical protein
MLIQERVSGPDMLLKLFVTIADWLKQVQLGLSPKHLPRDPRIVPPMPSPFTCLSAYSPTRCIIS